MADHVEALEENTDEDSTYDEELTSTTSLSSSIFDYEVEHGRRYHAFKSGAYVLPNDEEEQDRMDIQYHALRILFENKAILAPITPNPQCIVDIGTGTGIWVMDVGDQYPSAKVIGTDLSPIQPAFVPPNVQFEIEDATEFPWSFHDDSMDLVHSRIANGFVIREWKAFCQESFRTTKPGGWLECQEFDLTAFSDDGTVPPDGAIQQWCELMNEGALKGGINLHVSGAQIKEAMEKAGFKNIKVTDYKLPIGLWPADARLREAGKYALGAMFYGLQGISLAIFTRFLEWQVEEMEVLLAKVRQEWRQRKVHSYWPICVVYGQKPLKD